MQTNLDSTKKILLSKNIIRILPEIPGVYIFWQNTLPIYIGKAKNLKKRVGSYFAKNLLPKTQRMIESSNSFSFYRVDSELESLLLEASLIRSNLPKYNSAARDDKHPLYIKITSDTYPLVITTRKNDPRAYLDFYGPFPSSISVRGVLRMLRRIFPYADHKIGPKPCLYSHIGLCLPCPNYIEKLENPLERKALRRKYLENIKMVRGILTGRIGSVRGTLERKMQIAANAEEFENAKNIREQIAQLDYITQPIIPGEFFLENPNLTDDLRRQELGSLKKIISKYIYVESLNRIECFDIAHLAGTNPTASMITFKKGQADKNFYRHFKIRQTEGNNDVASMDEVARRRIKNLKAWGRPDLVIVDGGLAQTKTFTDRFKSSGIPVIGLAKRDERLVLPIAGTPNTFKFIKVPKGPALNLLQRIRNEAHRFARRYHHLLIKKQLVG